LLGGGRYDGEQQRNGEEVFHITRPGSNGSTRARS
jgi:hypothetical protein